MKPTIIVWEGSAVQVTHDCGMAKALGPYAVAVHGPTAAVIIGRTSDRAAAIRTAQRLDKYPSKARAFAGLA